MGRPIEPAMLKQTPCFVMSAFDQSGLGDEVFSNSCLERRVHGRKEIAELINKAREGVALAVWGDSS
jgi:hypothetical protein